VDRRESELTPEEVAYTAGLLDGEGCIQLKPYAKRNAHGLEVEIAQKRPAVLEWVEYRFGGYVGHWKRVSTWRIYGEKALNFLQQVHPYLIVKHAECELVLNWWAGRTRYGRFNAKRDSCFASQLKGLRAD
jgi:hypothetical protein